MTNPRDRLDRARREEIIRAGWEGDKALRADLGSYEAATWEIGACARDPQRVHPYNQSTWQADIDAYRKKWSTPTPDVSAPVVDLAEIERLVEALIKECLSDYHHTPESRDVVEGRQALLTAIRQLAGPWVRRALDAEDELANANARIEDLERRPRLVHYREPEGVARQLASAPVAVPAPTWPRLTDAMIRAACKAHFRSDNADGVCVTAHEVDFSFRHAFKRMWKGAKKAFIAAEDARQLAARTAPASDADPLADPADAYDAGYHAGEAYGRKQAALSAPASDAGSVRWEGAPPMTTTPDIQPTSTVTALEVLKELEWSGFGQTAGGFTSICPMCGGFNPTIWKRGKPHFDSEVGHALTCRLAQALATDTTAERIAGLEARQ